MNQKALIPQPDLDANPMQMLQIAVQKGVDTEQLSKLMDLEERWRANKAREAYVRAMTAFKSEPTRILKTKQVSIPGGAQFAHAKLADVVDGTCATLSRHGLSHRWETTQANGGISVTCILTHESGHSERTTLTAPPDDSGKKNGIQAIGSTVTYLERYTLMAATGLAAADMDDDGSGGSDDDLMGHAEKLMECKTVPELAKLMNSLAPAVQKTLVPTFNKRKQELSGVKQ